ncbi:MAG: peptidylprolyl isomerase [Flavobacteriaceae bacterium]|jgi:peptidyl-prolyl cis-trans isomerase A (cyclophilin A)|nr:peptidylprolyl isomerase [Flavobacteriaceae bacterium]MBT4959493.1 peptidylprolyl isomerase [Flavobacteriaceae bacterium]MBT6170641.1 peptidylprolyl isomerase [Flavobacteriaceae bacterium]MBT7623504.1 peptidylprolyl isomerase [Flavobacteriaceae bacterium]MDG1830866.1 peptidylprolyl isomerase [Flavobacteriaceae bacterium]
MHLIKILMVISLLSFVSCKDISNNKPTKKIILKKEIKTKPIEKKEIFLLNDKNAIPFFYEYEKKNKENLVRIITDYGNIDIKLFENTPYHRANFIFLTKKNYFDGEYFHRVVKDFIIQGGNSDNRKTSTKRRSIGRYLLPPDTKKGHKHHRGIISMPSSEIENPHKLASPYEFFIVQKKDGAYHLDGNYTAFGKVIKGMNVVDIIANLETDKREWPINNVRFKTVIIN